MMEQEIYNTCVLYMSGRSGYGRSKMSGKIVHLPANMMAAGLAPRVGKSGASIRLYQRRVNECLSCVPIKILKRIFVTGNSVTDAVLTASNGFKPNLTLTAALAGAQAYYGIVFNRKIEMTNTTIPVTGEVIPLNQVDVAGTNTLVTTLAATDFLKITASNSWGLVGNQFNIGIGSQTTSPTVWAPLNQTTGITSTLNVTTGAAAYIVTNTAKLGGHALLFNVTQILNSSHNSTNNSTTGITSVTGGVFRTNLLVMTTTNNNISTTYTPGSLTTPEPCFLGQNLTVSAPVGNFTIVDTTGLPTLELLA
jgi:hypothetical protein